MISWCPMVPASRDFGDELEGPRKPRQTSLLKSVWPECLFWIGMSGFVAVMVAMLVHYN